MSIFLTDEDLEHLTGIKKGSGGVSKHELQCEFLMRSGIQFIKNARGAPVVTQASIEGKKPERVTKSWEPRALHA